jgi:hypothetical protein
MMFFALGFQRLEDAREEFRRFSWCLVEYRDIYACGDDPLYIPREYPKHESCERKTWKNRCDVSMEKHAPSSLLIFVVS